MRSNFAYFQHAFSFVNKNWYIILVTLVLNLPIFLSGYFKISVAIGLIFQFLAFSWWLGRFEIIKKLLKGGKPTFTDIQKTVIKYAKKIWLWYLGLLFVLGIAFIFLFVMITTAFMKKNLRSIEIQGREVRKQYIQSQIEQLYKEKTYYNLANQIINVKNPIVIDSLTSAIIFVFSLLLTTSVIFKITYQYQISKAIKAGTSFIISNYKYMLLYFLLWFAFIFLLNNTPHLFGWKITVDSLRDPNLRFYFKSSFILGTYVHLIFDAALVSYILARRKLFDENEVIPKIGSNSVY